MEVNVIESKEVSHSWNISEHVDFDNLHMDSTFTFLLCSLIWAIAWIVYITYYNSRVTGYILKLLVKRFICDESTYINIGSFAICALSGKVMFKNIVYITPDYTVRIQDGWLIFRWWRAYIPKDVSEDLSHSDTRVSILLNGFELHIYNRSALYSHLEETFGLQPSIIPWENLNRKGDVEAGYIHDPGGKTNFVALGKSWRDLIPVIKVDVTAGRLICGNRLIPTTLSVNCDEAHFVYSTKPAASKLDHFMHFVKCTADNFKVILAPSPKYTGINDDPPRYMGVGFVIASSNKIEIYYYMDEPGLVPEKPEMLRLANGDIVESAPPIWGMDIKCGKGTDFSYGPWADRQRENLFKLFYPQDFQDLKITKAPMIGQLRQVQSFDIRLSTLYESTMDLLFTKNKETNAAHVNIGPGSYLEVTLPWIVTNDGYTTKITGQMLHVDATTSLQFRSLMECETLEFGWKCHYPLLWNGHQDWNINLTGCKTTYWFVYQHKEFFQDLINDWSSRSKSDLLHFIPYTVDISILLKEFEFITLANEYNWIDCSSQNQENSHIAICGDLFDFSFSLPFVSFLPQLLPLRFWIQGEDVDLSMYLPETYTSRDVLLAIDKNAKLLSRDGSHLPSHKISNKRKWRRVCVPCDGWIDFWSVPIAAISIDFKFHPMPPFGPTPQADITTPEKEEMLLLPMRMPGSGDCSPEERVQDLSAADERERNQLNLQNEPEETSVEVAESIRSSKEELSTEWEKLSSFNKTNGKHPDGPALEMEAVEKKTIFDPSTMTPDEVRLELEVGPSVLLLYGTWLLHLLHLKENVFGYDDKYVDMNDSPPNATQSKGANEKNECKTDSYSVKKTLDYREYRPLNVIISITLHDIQAHLMKACVEKDPPCPVVVLERFGFEMKMDYKEMLLQLLLSPAILISNDVPGSRSFRDNHLNQGHLVLSGLQVRGHALFSDTGRRLDQRILEYAWMLEIQVGKLSGKMTFSQLTHVTIGIETLILLMMDSENKLHPPRSPDECLHSVPPSECPEAQPYGSYCCPSPNDIKYRMVRCAIDAIDFYLVESGTAINIWASPIRIATCNLHGNHMRNGVTCMLPAVRIRNMISFNLPGQHHLGINSHNSHSSSNKSQNMSDLSEKWLEVGTVCFGPLIIEAASSYSGDDKNINLTQHKFLKYHDERNKKLWFIWPSNKQQMVTGRCGCVGGCVFFGRNRNGQRFFKPSRCDLQDGINVAAYRINEGNKDPGFGQSILYDLKLVFHTAPYSSVIMTIHDQPDNICVDSNIANSCMENNLDNGKSSKKILLSPTIWSTRSTPVCRAKNHENNSLSPSTSGQFSHSSSFNKSPNLDNVRKSLNESSKKFIPLVCGQKLGVLRSIISVPEKINTKLAYGITDSKKQLSDGKAKDKIRASFMADKIVKKENEYMKALRTGSVASLIDRKYPPLRLTKHSVKGDGFVYTSMENDADVFYSTDHDIHGKIAPARKYSGSVESLPLNDNSNLKRGRNHSSNDYDTTLYKEDYNTIEQIHLESENRLLLDSSDSHSNSSLSFMSAVSSLEDLTLVNLHRQVNKPIVESSLLMSTYVNHLSQMSCNNWTNSSLPFGSEAFKIPFFQICADGHYAFVGNKYLPHFETVTDGFTALKMVDRKTSEESQPLPATAKTNYSCYPWNTTYSGFNLNNPEDFDFNEELLSIRNESGSRTTVIVKMKGDVEILLTPLVLESLQRFIDSLTNTLSHLHPVTVLNHLHMLSNSRVESANVLKKDKYLSRMQGGAGSSKRNTVDASAKIYAHQEPCNVYEECITSQIQGTFTLPRINVAILQASIVEEVISFSALDNFRDITCAALLAISFDEITLRFHHGTQVREVVQTFHRPSIAPNGQKKGVFSRALMLGLHLTGSTNKDSVRGEPVYIETSEKQQRETVFTLNISKGHMQLRRLRNECSILNEAEITAISSHSSKVFFKAIMHPTSMKFDGEESNDVQANDDRLGFIMMECGLEGISFKLVKRSKEEKDEDQKARSPRIDSDKLESDSKSSCASNQEKSKKGIKKNFNTPKCTPRRDAKAKLKDVIIEIPDNVANVTKSVFRFESKCSPNADSKTSSSGEEKAGSVTAESAFDYLKKLIPSDSRKNNQSSSPNATNIYDHQSNKNIAESNTIENGEEKPPSSPITPIVTITQPQNADTTSTEGTSSSTTTTAFVFQSSDLSDNSHDQKKEHQDNGLKMDDNASSCVIELKQVWFNFAAPPRTPITRKIDYTRLDWNLLSTVSPAINAWMNPSNRFAIRVVHMFRSYYKRSTAIITCLMAEALDVQRLHKMPKSRYGKISPMAKTLQDDPSCQLLNILTKYLNEFDSIESYLSDQDVPHLSILRQGVIVLTRQWKNILYTPLLLDHNFKSKCNVTKPLVVTFAIPEPDEDNSPCEDLSSEDEPDENALLLKPSSNESATNFTSGFKMPFLKSGYLASGSQSNPNNNVGTNRDASNSLSPPQNENIFSNTDPAIPVIPPPRRKRKSQSPQVPSTTATNKVLSQPMNVWTVPLPEATDHASSTNLGSVRINMMEGNLADDRRTSSNSSLNKSMTSKGSAKKDSLKKEPPEDLYTWMAKQGFRDSQSKIKECRVAGSTFWEMPKDESETKTPPPTSPDYTILASSGYSLYPMHDSLRLLDAHLIFEPLLSSLGVIPQQMISNRGGGNNGDTPFDSWGSNLTLVASMNSFRIDIVISDEGRSYEGRSYAGAKCSRSAGLFETSSSKMPSLDVSGDVAAFLCENVKIDCDVSRAADTTIVEDLNRQRRSMLYVSRGQLKKHSNTAVKVSVSIKYISQQVNMPLLRLLHQLTNMYENVKETRMELKEQPPFDVIKLLSSRPTPASTIDRREGRLFSSDRNRIGSGSDRSKKDGSPLPLVHSSKANYGSRASSVRDRVFSSDRRKEYGPRCWKTIFHLLDLYAAMPESKMVTHRISLTGDLPAPFRNKKCDKEEKSAENENSPAKLLQNMVFGEKTRLVVSAVARIERSRLQASISGLKLEAELENTSCGFSCKRKIKPSTFEYSATSQIGRTMIVLLEGIAPKQQTVVQVTIDDSQASYSCAKGKNSALMTVGETVVDIPQHPVALHGMMTRGTKQLSTTLQELRVRPSSRIQRSNAFDETDSTPKNEVPLPSKSVNKIKDQPVATKTNLIAVAEEERASSFLVNFNTMIKSLSVSASLLPSLQAQYKIENLTSSGLIGCQTKFILDLSRHWLSFSTKTVVMETNIPSEANIELPKVHMMAEYIGNNMKVTECPFAATDGAVLREGNYLNANADISAFEHSLSTDLLNHLVFVQKVFMKEVNEVVQKVYGGEKPVPIWSEGDVARPNVNHFLFSLVVKVKRIQLTATTPTNCAVRLETDAVDFQLTNRVQNISGASSNSSSASKIFLKTRVDIDLSLGQLVKNILFEEADPDFQQFAFFKTNVALRNAFQGEMVGEETDKEVVLITLQRPLIYVQPIAVDKAILVWLNYKNAYEYWNEQRSNLYKEVVTATHHLPEKVVNERICRDADATSSFLFLQLTVEDMGICVPLQSSPPMTWKLNRSLLTDESCSAVVITLESTSISACNSTSLVSKGRFTGLCLRFADDFEISLDDWKPDASNDIQGMLMNVCSVSEGTYEVCSRTISQKTELENAKWLLNVQWQMEGVVIHLDVNIGKQLSALGQTLTSLTSVQEEDTLTPGTISLDYDNFSQFSSECGEDFKLKNDNSPLSLPFENATQARRHYKILEKEMYEQVKVVNDLKVLGASQLTIDEEVRRLYELENLVFKGFRRDMIEKLRRQSIKKKSNLKDKFGLGNKGNYSKTFFPSPTEKEESPSSTDEHISTWTSHPTLPAVNGDNMEPAKSVDRSSNPDLACRADGETWQKVFNSNKSSNNVTMDNKSASVKEEKTGTGTESTRNNSVGYNAKMHEPNIDFELDVKVFINSGKCVLHTKSDATVEYLKNIKKRHYSKSHHSGHLYNSPIINKKARLSHKSVSFSTRLRHYYYSPTTFHQSQLTELTVFHIPGLDVKVHYNSKTIADGSFSPSYTVDSYGVISRKSNTKKASLFAWITLHSIPEETIISPHILEFLEQTLEPIPLAERDRANSLLNASETDDDLFTRYVISDQYMYTSFPVDVVVYFHMQPSTFRFSCLPVSRVECMLKLPSLNMVFSSKRAENNENASASNSSLPVAVGGLSITGVLADFSLYIFHPYGKKVSSSFRDFEVPLANEERKDSLNVNVEFVKFHLSRSRKLNFESSKMLGRSHGSSHADIRFSTIVDIGCASFKYDMRKLTEILAFPKAWYKQNVIRRLFIGGDITKAPNYGGAEPLSTSNVTQSKVNLINDRDRLEKILKKYGTLGEEEKSNGEPSPKLDENSRELDSTNSEDRLREIFKKLGSVDASVGERTSRYENRTSWHSLILFSINFKKLNVQMNMGNVMGNVTWLTKNFHSEGRLSVGNSGHKNIFVAIGLERSWWDAKSGIVGGSFDISQVDAFVRVAEDCGVEPCHTFGLKLFAMELKLDYMGTAILMSRVSSLDIQLRDEWKLEQVIPSERSREGFKQAATVKVRGQMSWDQLQIMISKSSVVDLIKMYYKLEEFFSQQFKSSKRVLHSLQQEPHRNRSPRRSMSQHKYNIIGEATCDSEESLSEKRHWQSTFVNVANLRLSTMNKCLPSRGTIVGGTMNLHGSHISLAFFHGINFKSKSWALFSLKEPRISFSTEAQEIIISENSDGYEDIHVEQNLSFGLGTNPDSNKSESENQRANVAIVCKVSRTVVYPPQFRTVQEWFHYTFSCSEIDAIDKFPNLELGSLNSSVDFRNRTSKSHDSTNHNREIIFALPSTQLNLKTEHLQFAVKCDGRPVVNCSFVTEFEDHIFVTVDAEAFFFLHDVITSYMREKNRAASSQKDSPKTQRKYNNAQNMNSDDLEALSGDNRDFICRTWHLEPTVRLLSWGGTSIEPYGVDYILQKLGFSHARTTIPKWMQRGFMDPLDKILAVLLLKLVACAKEEPKHDAR